MAAAREWLCTGKAPRDRAHEVALASLLLQGQVPCSGAVLNSRPLGEDVECALLREAAARGRWELASLLADEAQHKATRKEARKTLFTARQRGLLAASAPSDTRRPVSLGATFEIPPSMCSHFDGEGSYMVAWTFDDGMRNARALIGAISGEDELLMAVFVDQTNRTRLRTALSAVRPGLDLCEELPSAAASWLLRDALERASARGCEVQGDLLRARRLLADAEAPPLTAAAPTPAGGEREAVRAEAPRLLREPPLRLWLAGLAPATLSVQRDVVAASATSVALGSAERLAARLELIAVLLTQRRQAAAAALVACAAADVRLDPAAALREDPVLLHVLTGEATAKPAASR